MLDNSIPKHSEHFFTNDVQRVLMDMGPMDI